MRGVIIVAAFVATFPAAGLAQTRAPINCPYDPRCLNNPYGAGSPYKPDGLNNPYSPQGSPYSNTSPNNPYATNPPRLYDESGTYRGNLSSNPYDPNSTSNPYGRYGSPYSPDSVNNPYAPKTNVYVIPSN